MQVKIKPWKKPSKRKGWGLTSSIQPQVSLNKMGASSTSLLLCAISNRLLIRHRYVIVPGKTLMPQSCQHNEGTVKSK